MLFNWFFICNSQTYNSGNCLSVCLLTECSCYLLPEALHIVMGKSQSSCYLTLTSTPKCKFHFPSRKNRPWTFFTQEAISSTPFISLPWIKRSPLSAGALDKCHRLIHLLSGDNSENRDKMTIGNRRWQWGEGEKGWGFRCSYSLTCCKYHLIDHNAT